MIRHWLPPFSRCAVCDAGVCRHRHGFAQDKLDRALREGKRAGKSQRVIVKAKPGYETWARQLLEQGGKRSTRSCRASARSL